MATDGCNECECEDGILECSNDYCPPRKFSTISTNPASDVHTILSITFSLQLSIEICVLGTVMSNNSLFFLQYSSFHCFLLFDMSCSPLVKTRQLVFILVYKYKKFKGFLFYI